MARMSYENCLERSYRINWRIDEVVEGRRFDPDRDWLPKALSGAHGLPFLDAGERRALNHVEMAAYAHLFSYAEEFVAPTTIELAAEVEQTEREAFDALTNFTAEEVKHMVMFRRVGALVDDALGFELERLGGQQETVRFVRSKNRGAVLLLMACIEWFTQEHYRSCFSDDDGLDPFTRHIFRCHWLEESQHAQLDHLETLRAFDTFDEAKRERAIDDLIELVAAVDGWLVEQTAHDLRNFERVIGRQLSSAQRDQVRDSVLRAKRYTFLASGVTHPRFQELFGLVTTEPQRQRVEEALGTLLPDVGDGDPTPVAA